jgi:hypothetical protein
VTSADSPPLSECSSSPRSQAEAPLEKDRRILAFTENRLGLFGFWGSYTTIAWVTVETLSDIEADWSEAISKVAAWRLKRAELATILFIYFTVPQQFVTNVTSHVANLVVADRDRFPPEFGGLQIEVSIWDQRLAQHLYLKLFPQLRGGNDGLTS